MPLSPSHLSALTKIAELACSRKPVDDRLEQILSIARIALGIDALCLVAANTTTENRKTWHSFSPTCLVDSADFTTRALNLVSSINTTTPSGHIVIPLPRTDGVKAAMVGLGQATDEAATLLQTVSSYVSLLIENQQLLSAVSESKQSAGRRLEEIAAIYEIEQAMAPTHTQQLLDLIVAKAAVVMNAQTCSLMLTSSTENVLTIEASYGLAEDIVKGTRINIGEGIAGRVAETGEPALIVDVSSDPRFAGNAIPRPGISGSMCVPLKEDTGKVTGVISIRRSAEQLAFTEEDLKIFEVFATHASLALQNANLYSRLNRKVQEMATISEVLKSINSTLDLGHVLNQIAESITNVVGFDRCCVYLKDSRTGELVVGAKMGYSVESPVRERVPFDEGIIGLAAREQIPIFSYASPAGASNAEGEFLAAPIVVRDECIGVVVVDNSARNLPIQSEDVELLATFVSQAGIAVENARLYEAMEEKYSELNVLYEHSRSISAAYGLDNAAQTVVTAAARAVKSDGAGLLLLDQRRGHLTLQAADGSVAEKSKEIEQIAASEECVKMVRGMRSPRLLSAGSEERRQGKGGNLLNALATDGANLLVAPLVVEDTTIGLLSLSKQSVQFQSSEFKLISIVASHAATVLKNAMNYEQKMQQKVLELSAIYEFSKKISSAANLEEALDSILAIVSDLVDNDESFIYAIDHEHQTVAVKAARFRGEPRDTPEEEPLDGGSIVTWAIGERKALVSPDISRDPRFKSLGDAGTGVRSLMAIPLIVHDEVVGVLSVHSYSPNQYTEDDVRVLSIIASQGAAIYNELEALTALTSYTDNILSSIAAGVVALSSEGVVLHWNSAAEKIVGMKFSDVFGLDFEQVLALIPISEDDRSGLRAAIRSVYQTGETYQGYKLSFHPENSDELYLNMSVSQLLNSANEQLGLVIIFEDVTHEIKMENEFRRMGELAAVGQLAASIAHELRNPLSSIKGAAQYLQKEYENETSIVEFLGIIIEEVNGLSRLTTEFLDYARPMQLELQPVSVNKVVEKVLQLMSVHITDSNVVVQEKLDPSVPDIHADGKQLEQVLKNMVLNSLQAMPEGGSLTLETGRTTSGGAYINVTDTGHGISQEKLERIFQPFFTTKTKGTGLGLSVVHKIVENHGGRIEVSSEIGKGTTFKIIMPRTGSKLTISEDYDQTMERRE